MCRFGSVPRITSSPNYVLQRKDRTWPAHGGPKEEPERLSGYESGKHSSNFHANAKRYGRIEVGPGWDG